MLRNYGAFDIETAKILPAVVPDVKAHRPLELSVVTDARRARNFGRMQPGNRETENRE